MAGSQGILERHAKACRSNNGGRCNCSPSYMAHVWSNAQQKRIYKTCKTKTEARQWRHDALAALRVGTMSAPTRVTIKEAGAALIGGMRAGAILDRSGKRYKPATIRSYERALRLRLEPAFGSRRVSDLKRGEVQAFVERLNAEGLSARTVLNALDPLRVICRRAIRSGERTTDPTDGLELPRVRGRRERIATRQEAATLIEALPVGERALWATAFYGGLRRGELRALRWSDVDLVSAPAVINVRRTWDDSEGEVEAKSDAGMRTVPLTGRLRSFIVDHGLATSRGGDDLVFGETARQAFTPSTIRRRAINAWESTNKETTAKAQQAGVDVDPALLLRPLTPHEARHCAASYLIDAGLNDLELTSMIGHSDPRTTKMIYGHLFPDSSATIAAKLDTYLETDA